MKYLFALLLVLTAGCFSPSITIDTVKPWEGHYMNTNDFYKATKDILLDKNLTIWVLSDSTLNRVLKNVERK